MKMKKILTTLMAMLALFTLVACSKGNDEKFPTDLNKLMDAVYAGLDDEVPSTRREKVTADNVEYYLGLSECNFEEALASEPDMRSIAHSVVLVKAKSASDIDALKKEISEKLNPNKWVCVGVAEIKMASHDNILLVVMDDEVGDKMIENFNNLSK